MYRTYIRHLLRNKVYSAVNIAGLSLGLAAAMLILLFVKDELSFDRFQTTSPLYRIVRRMDNPDGTRRASDGYTGLLQGPRFTANIPGIRSYVRLINNYQDIKHNTDIQSQQILRVDSNFFTFFNFPLLQGDPRTALSRPNTLVISEDMARREFGGHTDVLNRTLLIKKDGGFQPYTITGIARNCPQNSSIRFEALTPIDTRSSNQSSSDAWLDVYLNTFVELAPNADPRQIEQRMQEVYDREARTQLSTATPPSAQKHTDRYLLQPITAMHLSTEYPPIDGLVAASDPVYSYILSGIAAFILLIACINFVNLTIARSLRRAREIGIRKVIGSSRRQLIIRFLGESAVLCALAFSLAIGLVQLLLPLFNQLSGKALALSYLLDTRLVAEYIGLFAATTFAAGFYPALVLSGYNPVTTLYGRFTLGGRNLLQRSLVTLQFALASFLIMATAIITAQFHFLTHLDLGYNDKDLVVVYQWGMKPGQFNAIAQDLRRSPDVLGVSGRNAGWDNARAIAEGQRQQINTTIETVDANYLSMLDIPIVAGRGFSPGYSADSTQSVLVNETFAREAGWKDPIGRTITLPVENNKSVRVVGVVRDHYFQPLNVRIKAQIFSLTLGRGITGFFIKIKPHSEASALPFIGKTFKARLPLNPFDYYFKDQENRNNYAAEEKWREVVGFGAAVTIFLSCIGLFGLSVFAAEKRTKEIGIRKVLGAPVTGIAAQLSSAFLRLVVLALLIAIPVAWLAANQWLGNYPYRIPLSPWLFAGAALLVVAIAAVTVSTHAIKAAMANPVKSLRSE